MNTSYGLPLSQLSKREFFCSCGCSFSVWFKINSKQDFLMVARKQKWFFGNLFWDSSNLVRHPFTPCSHWLTLIIILHSIILVNSSALIRGITFFSSKRSHKNSKYLESEAFITKPRPQYKRRLICTNHWTESTILILVTLSFRSTTKTELAYRLNGKNQILSTLLMII